MRVLMHVQHLLGTGHLRRIAALARALARRGADVVVASGGVPVPGLRLDAARLLQLPPARAADAGYARLVGPRGEPLDDAWRRRRRERLLEALDAHRPQAVIVETYPFGRKLIARELEALVAAARRARPRPRLLCSLRDIVEPRSAAREREMAGVARAWFDAVLVHSDRRLVPLEASFGSAADLGDRLRYTGYVVEGPARPAWGGSAGRDEVVVSVGGGAVGARLLEAAARAAALAAPRRPWRLLTGAAPKPRHRAALERRAAPARPVVEPNRGDFAALLGRCRVSVSQAGYNTVAEGLAARARLVLVPFAGAGEREQGIRAARLARRGLATVVPEASLRPHRLARAVARRAAAPRPRPGEVDLDGADRSARIVLGADEGEGP